MFNILTFVRTMAGHLAELEGRYEDVIIGHGTASPIWQEVIEEFRERKDQEVGRALTTILKGMLVGDDVDEYFYSEAFRHIPDLMQLSYTKRVREANRGVLPPLEDEW